jgi:hypothetical protein
MSDAETLLPAAVAAPLRQLIPSRFQNAEHARTVWRVVAEEATEIEDILKPIFWAHVGHYMQRFDRIEVLADDETWFVELLVRDAGRGFAKVAVLSKHTFEDATEAPSTIEGFEVVWKGPIRKFVVIRNADRSLLKEQLANKAQAIAWTQEFIRAGGN